MSSPKKRGRGRPKNSKTVFTQNGLTLWENYWRASNGDEKNSAGTHAAMELHLALTWASLAGVFPGTDMNGKPASLAEVKKAGVRAFSEEAARRFEQCDAAFFKDIAAFVQRCRPGKGPRAHNEWRANLLMYVLDGLCANSARRFTAAELLDKVPWGDAGSPDEKTVRNLVRELGIPTPKSAGAPSGFERATQALAEYLKLNSE